MRVPLLRAMKPAQGTRPIPAMKQHSWLLVLLLWLFAPGALAQNAKATLSTRVEGEIVKAAIEFRIDSGWHLFHTELGGPKAIGVPLKLEWGGSAVAGWSAPRLPEPKVYLTPGESEDAWAWIHRGRITVHALGRLVPGADANDIRVQVSGQTCMDLGGLCSQYEEELRTQGAGADKAFADFPGDLVVPEPAAAQSASESSSAAPGAESDQGTRQDAAWEPEFSSGQHATARAFLRVDGERARLAIQVAIEEEFHLYHGPTPADMGEGVTGLPTTFAITGGNVEWGPVAYPEPIEHVQKAFAEGEPDLPYNAHEGLVVFHAEGKVSGKADPAAVRIAIDGLTCDASGCTPYGEEITPAIGGPDELFPAAVPASSGPQSDYSSMPLGTFLLLAVFGGIFALLMPCTYPMIPITISFFTKQAIARKGNVLPLALAYGMGIIAIFIAIALVVGPGILPFANHPITNVVIGVLFVVFAFSLFGAYELRPPAFLLGVAGRASSSGGILGVFLLGATLVVTSFTCTAPFVGTLLSIGATEGGSNLRTALGMGVFGLTMAVPFVFLSLLPGKVQSIPKAGEWMHVLKVYLGFVELAAALKFISNCDLTWGWGILSREVFLALWVGIFATAGMFLLGRIRLKGESELEIGPWRMVGGLANLLLAGYFALGVIGYDLDDTTTALLPNYRSERLWSGTGGESIERHTIIKDDLAAAIDLARNEQKLLLINFTGFN